MDVKARSRQPVGGISWGDRLLERVTGRGATLLGSIFEVLSALGHVILEFLSTQGPFLSVPPFLVKIFHLSTREPLK